MANTTSKDTAKAPEPKGSAQAADESAGQVEPAEGPALPVDSANLTKEDAAAKPAEDAEEVPAGYTAVTLSAHWRDKLSGSDFQPGDVVILPNDRARSLNAAGYVDRSKTSLPQ